MRFVELSDSYDAAYRAFLARLGQGAVDGEIRLPFSYYRSSSGIVVRQHLVIDDSGDAPLVVGAACVKIQTYMVAGEPVEAAVVVYPVSLGIVDPKYAMVGIFLFRKLDQHYPFNLLLGMGPPETSAAAKLTSLLGWRLDPVPYLFLPIRLGPLVAKTFASRPAVAKAARLAGALGLFSPVQAVMARKGAGAAGCVLKVEPVDEFDARVDAFWDPYRARTPFTLERTAAQLNAMFPSEVPAFRKLVILDGDVVVALAVILVPPADHPRFGGVATLVEFSAPDEILAAAAAWLVRYLRRQKLTAVIANTPHAATIAALEAQGFRRRETSVYLAISKALHQLLEGKAIKLEDMVIGRGDGDGPIGLGVDL